MLTMRVSSIFTTSLIVDLLLLTNGSKHHYVLISDLQKLVEYVPHKVHRFESEICCKRLHTCASFETLRRHKELCYQDEVVVMTRPKLGKDDHKFKNLTALWYVPRVIYFDLESLLLPVYVPQPHPKKSSTQTIEIHQPCGYALAVTEFGTKDLFKFELKRGPNVMEELISSLESLARQIYVEKKTHLIIVITPMSFWVGLTMSVTLIEKQQITFQW